MQSLDLAYGYLCTGANLLHLSGWNGAHLSSEATALSPRISPNARRPPPGALAARC